MTPGPTKHVSWLSHYKQNDLVILGKLETEDHMSQSNSPSLFHHPQRVGRLLQNLLFSGLRSGTQRGLSSDLRGTEVQKPRNGLGYVF